MKTSLRQLDCRVIGMVSALVVVFGLGLAEGQSVTIGTPSVDGGNEYPFGSTIPAYQQVYAATDFSGPIVISGITFFNTTNPAGSIDPATYQIELSTTSAAVNGLSATFASNYGSDNTTVFDGILSGSASPSFTIPTTSFQYNPSMGNLLLTIFQTGSTQTSTVFLDAYSTDSGGLFSRTYSFSGTTGANGEDGWGLVTEFDAVPEPSTYAMLIAGFGLLVIRFRGRRA
jgi:hypothetical protein